MTFPEPPTHVPDGETPAAECPHCGRPFRSGDDRDLHVGEHHADAWTDDQRRAYEAALERERDDLWLFHARAVVALGVTYAATVILYMVVLGTVL